MTDAAKLAEALREIARQKKTDELETEYDVEVADFEGGYDACIDTARAAIATYDAAPAPSDDLAERMRWGDTLLDQAVATLQLLLSVAQQFEAQASRGTGGRRGGPVFTKARAVIAKIEAYKDAQK